MTPSGVKIDAFEIPDDLIDHSVPVLRTAEGIEFVRTPDERFEGLEGYPFAPHYLEIDGLRVHYVDEGPADGPLVVLMHGQPTWSYLYRTMIPLLVDAGMRVVAWDNIGFGRSDKPIDPMIHTYVHHVTWFHQIIERLDLVDITLFCQDWGGVIGLRVVAEDPDRFVRVVAANTGLIEASALSTGGEPPITLPSIAVMGTERRGFIEAASADDPTSMNFRDGFQWWIDFALHAANFSVGEFVFATTRGKVSAEVMAGYDAPFPSFIYQMAPHAFPAHHRRQQCRGMGCPRSVRQTIPLSGRRLRHHRQSSGPRAPHGPHPGRSWPGPRALRRRALHPRRDGAGHGRADPWLHGGQPSLIQETPAWPKGRSTRPSQPYGADPFMYWGFPLPIWLLKWQNVKTSCEADPERPDGLKVGTRSADAPQAQFTTESRRPA